MWHTLQDMTRGLVRHLPNDQGVRSHDLDELKPLHSTLVNTSAPVHVTLISTRQLRWSPAER